MTRVLMVILPVLAGLCFVPAIVPAGSGFALWLWALGFLLLIAALVIAVRRARRD
ncbi:MULTISPECIES: cytochrome c-type biogenesis protein CcmH [unclassified Brevibacterium]|uniref:cytochrome c-type biogenesis protein CcmH n=1 Tax=unclassified Brevibacterium TaxID=2614124 RepID=UPI0010F62F27|nr:MULTISPECIES: cytochrome c-type biogenesis protein CcmH [unclassified Brevibacterium]MCM1013593.1 hypothetical protein [Brevibacterium sp. XM4083]